MFLRRLTSRRAAAPAASIPPGTLAVSDPGVRERIAFLGLTAEDLGVMLRWAPPCRQHIDRVLDAFYAHVVANASASGRCCSATC